MACSIKSIPYGLSDYATLTRDNCYYVDKTHFIPLIDDNIRTDYNKLRHLIKVDKELGPNFSVIREVVETGQTTAVLNTAFSVERITNPDNFKSLLYYFGLLSIQGTKYGEAVLGIPNHTVREQMYTYLTEGFADSNIFRIDFYQLGELMKKIAYWGEWQPVFAYIASDEVVTSTLGQAKLRLITVVFRGWELAGMEETEM
ncbi:hypothetical protein LJC05_02510 [Bacteroides sp. OttesenSCG-928-J23]|nr:hypothetical protein [Bacteroides sp. OttesenSCG-928-J23]MDL2299706.1 hypothetical protein [Bacteroides sp. OttesenSCG-928-E20]